MLPALLPFLFAIFWASSYAAAKIGLADIGPYLFVAAEDNGLTAYTPSG